MTYIFDMDGTLIDSMPTFGEVIIDFLDKSGKDYPKDVLKTVVPLGFEGTAKYFEEVLGIEISSGDAVKKLISNMMYRYENTIPAKPGVPEKLRELKKEGHTLAVLTASPHLTLDPCLKRLGLTELFDKIWSTDDFGLTKANPDIYIRAAEALGAHPSDCIFVDDNIIAVTTAKAAGLHAYGIFDEASSEYEEKMRKVAERYIIDFSLL